MIIFVILVFLMIGDIYSTFLAFKAGYGEKNPIFKWILKKLGMTVFFILGSIGKMGGLVLLYIADLWWLNIIVMIWLSYAVSNNLVNAGKAK